MLPAGFLEVSHTADRSLRVWAPTMDELFCQAARGMYQLMGTLPEDSRQYYRNISISAGDQEGLLVAFLNEMLYLLEHDGLIFNEFFFTHGEDFLQIKISGNHARKDYSEIKAATYHKLEIQHKMGVYEVIIVFDI
jgi:SHS2 domain-containing protein